MWCVVDVFLLNKEHGQRQSLLRCYSCKKVRQTAVSSAICVTKISEHAFIPFCHIVFNSSQYYHIQSWPKISPPLQFCQKMQPFSQKIVAVTNVLVLACLFFFIGTTKNWRKVKSDAIPHRTPQNASYNHEWVSSTSLLAFWTTLLLQTISECFLKCVSGHCPAGRPITSGGDAAFWHWPLRCAPKLFGNHQISSYRSHSQGIQCQKQQSNPKTSWTSTMFDCTVCFSFSVNSSMMSFTKKLFFCLICPHTVRSPRRIVVLSQVLANSSLAFLCLCVSRGVLLVLPFHSDGDG